MKAFNTSIYFSLLSLMAACGAPNDTGDQAETLTAQSNEDNAIGAEDLNRRPMRCVYVWDEGEWGDTPTFHYNVITVGAAGICHQSNTHTFDEQTGRDAAVAELRAQERNQRELPECLAITLDAPVTSGNYILADQIHHIVNGANEPNLFSNHDMSSARLRLEVQTGCILGVQANAVRVKDTKNRCGEVIPNQFWNDKPARRQIYDATHNVKIATDGVVRSENNLLIEVHDSEIPLSFAATAIPLAKKFFSLASHAITSPRQQLQWIKLFLDFQICEDTNK